MKDFIKILLSKESYSLNNLLTWVPWECPWPNESYYMTAEALTNSLYQIAEFIRLCETMAVNTKNYKVLPWKEKLYSSIPGKYITNKVALLHPGCVAWQFLTQEYFWKTVKFTGRLVHKIPGHKAEMELQLLQQIPQARDRGHPEKPTHPAGRVARGASEQAAMLLPGTQRALGAQIQQDHQGSRLLAKEARDRPQKEKWGSLHYVLQVILQIISGIILAPLILGLISRKTGPLARTPTFPKFSGSILNFDLWKSNQLPDFVRSPSLDVFKTGLKKALSNLIWSQSWHRAGDWTRDLP